MVLKFGTDGVRGLAHTELTAELVSHLAFATAKTIDVNEFIIGTDGRESGEIFANALAGGFKSAGATSKYLGIVPTPGIAHIASHFGVGGAVISASHNKAEYNGVKFFLPNGQKLSDETQKSIETILNNRISTQMPLVDIEITPDAHVYLTSWINSLKGASVQNNLDDLSIVIDCANGAASNIAPQLFKEFGAKLSVMHSEPNGNNINRNCGSTHMGSLQLAVNELSADLGLAFDGDADRVLAIDNQGNTIDGDYLLAIFAKDFKIRSTLKDNTVVATVMANMGFHEAMEASDIAIHTTDVGDRHILKTLRENNWTLGGEQSGHIIFADKAETGDGILTALQLVNCLKRSEMGLHELAQSSMQKFPQLLRSVELKDQLNKQNNIIERIEPYILQAESMFINQGRVLVRRSGTEPILRVMVEGKEESEVHHVANTLTKSIEEALT
ncbi:MAG: phosphoglucosamine mutase [Acidimicrobiaceae bacterium]|jgi:phosphoglucosamine mutase|nr:phosphoglucosamine mutase [Acidimicrobiaceae bacterium]|tara:strand:- start:50371 stop:51702 length:1332 start_codon:yes stop_codon:yes gene_type:complete